MKDVIFFFFTNRSAAGITPLYLACRNGHFAIVKVLLLHSAKVDLPSSEKATPVNFINGFGWGQTINLDCFFLVVRGCRIWAYFDCKTFGWKWSQFER